MTISADQMDTAIEVLTREQAVNPAEIITAMALIDESRLELVDGTPLPPLSFRLDQLARRRKLQLEMAAEIAIEASLSTSVQGSFGGIIVRGRPSELLNWIRRLRPSFVFVLGASI